MADATRKSIEITIFRGLAGAVLDREKNQVSREGAKNAKGF